MHKAAIAAMEDIPRMPKTAQSLRTLSEELDVPFPG
jgi:hypothetical protein